MEPLIVALPKGRLLDDVMDLFEAIGYGMNTSEANSRRLLVSDQSGHLRYILAKPADVPIYVEHGAADLGVSGEDILRETDRDLYEPLGLGVGKCRLVLAGPTEARDWNLRLETNLRIATKYPRLALAYFRQRGISAEIIPLSGSIELAPTVDLADLLVDLVQTGRTLCENNLVELETIFESQAMLVVNRASYSLKFEAIQRIIRELSAEVVRRQRRGPS